MIIKTRLIWMFDAKNVPLSFETYSIISSIKHTHAEQFFSYKNIFSVDFDFNLDF